MQDSLTIRSKAKFVGRAGIPVDGAGETVPTSIRMKLDSYLSLAVSITSKWVRCNMVRPKTKKRKQGKHSRTLEWVKIFLAQFPKAQETKAKRQRQD